MSVFDLMVEAYLKDFRDKGHDPQLNEDTGKPDIMAWADDFHNGPVCIRCGWCNCMHCTKEIPVCKGEK